MRRRHTQNGDQDTEINLTPMMDIVFIMLIFFIVTTSFVKESGIEVDRPTAQSAERKERASILVAIDRDGAIWIDKRAVDVRAVRANIERLRAQNPQGGVVITADREATTGLLVQVMDQVRMAGVRDVSIATQRTGS